ncbi:MAG: metallophosphoesterase family protein [Byssovorax sp.]
MNDTRLYPIRLTAATLCAAGLLAALGASSASCGGVSSSGTGGGGGSGPSGPPTFKPEGCAFSIASRAEYKDFTPSKPTVGATPNIRRVRLGLGGNVTPGAEGHADPSSSIGIAWQTDDGTLASEVTWGTDPDPSKWPAENRASGVTWLTPEGTINSQGDERMHEVYLCGLSPATTYYYRAGGGPSGGEAWSDVRSFRTTPSDPKATVTIGLSGDSRGDNGNAFRLLQKKMKLASVDLQLFSGDMVNLATDQGAWEYWLDAAEKDLEGKPSTLGQILTLSTHGNHENHTSLFFGNLVLPQEIPGYAPFAELFFSVDVGPVHLVIVDDAWIINPTDDPAYGTDHDYTKTLTAWLEADLAAANKNRGKVPWIIVDHHHAEFSSSTHGTDADVLLGRSYFVPIYDKHHVDLGLGGHDHDYERSKPLTGAGGKLTFHDSPKDGTVYVGCAGAGAPAYSAGMSDFTSFSHDFTSNGAVGLYGILTVTQSTLKLEAHDTMPDGSDPVFDTFTLDK